VRKINWKAPAYVKTTKYRGGFNDRSFRCAICSKTVQPGEEIHRGPRNQSVAHKACVDALPEVAGK
jgi:hypothetical protein